MSFDLDETSLEAKLQGGASPRPAPPRPGGGGVEEAQQQIIVGGNDGVSVGDWFKQFSGQQVKIVLTRLQPENYKGLSISGMLESTEEFFDEEYVRTKYGGGKFQLRVMRVKPNGQPMYAGAKTFKIAGEPVLSPEMFPSHFAAMKASEESGAPAPIFMPPPTEDSSVAKTAMQMTAELTRQAMDRAERAEQKSGMDPVLISMLTKPMEMQLQVMAQQLAEKERIIAEKDRIIHDLSSRKPETSMQDRLIDKMYESESAKLLQLREQFDSERRMLIAGHQDEMRRVESRFDMDKANLIASHEREIKSMERSSEDRIRGTETAYEGRLEAKNNRIKDLELVINRLQAENNELRSKKEKTLADSMAEVVQMRETMTALGLFKDGEGEGEEPSTVEKVLGALAQNPVVQGLGARLAQPDAAKPAQPQQPQLTPAQAAQLQAARAKRRAEKQQQQAAAAAAARGEPPPPPTTLPSDVSPSDLQMAVQYMEGAVANNTDPNVFAQSARNAVPLSMINMIKQHGIDHFLDNVAKVNDASPLSTITGRRFARAVAKTLVEGS
jgi:hypothetical protein